MKNLFNLIELQTTDVAKAKTFYQELFDWKMNFCFATSLFRGRGGMTATARTPVLPTATPVGTLSARALNRSRGRGGERELR